MLNIAYNLSGNIQGNLKKIEELRRAIILSPLPRNIESKLKWENKLSMIWSDIAITESSLSRNQVAQIILKGDIPKKISIEGIEVLNLKRAIEYIDEHWYVSRNQITPQTLLYLYKMIGNTAQTPKEFTKHKDSLDKLFNYLQVKAENPVIQAGLAHLHIRIVSPFSSFNGRVARLTELVFLYKYGLDFRGLLNINSYWEKNWEQYKKITAQAAVTQNATMWLEFFTGALIEVLQKSLDDIHKSQRSESSLGALWRLSSRQKAILGLLEPPGSTVTNRQIQKLYKISQITASRDLTKLASLGIIVRRGKGRSVFYIKI